ncbi:MAG: hypothetical protein KDE31_10800, partial [Caldilineaceae bacterium]|nr:hypothetical protein [Caldilineaceae bacterium]
MNMQQTGTTVHRRPKRPPTVPIRYSIFCLLALLGLVFPWSAQASPASQLTAGSSDTSMATNGAAITAALASTVGDFSQAGSQLSLLPKAQPPALLARQDYQKVYDQANALLTTGVTFRHT